MTSQEHEERSLAEIDAADQAEVERVELVVLEVLRERPHRTISELSADVRTRAGDIDNSIIRAAILQLLNRNALHANGEPEAIAHLAR
jgi:hypothetical protein